MSATHPARGMRDFLPEDVRRRTHVGVPASRFFWKNTGPSIPLGQRLRVAGLFEAWGSRTSATAAR